MTGSPTISSLCQPLRILTAVLFLALGAAPVAAQERTPPTLQIDGFVPGGARPSATDSDGAYVFTVSNLTDVDRRARVLLFFSGQPDVQYGRDVWVPAKSTVASWALVGPPPAQAKGNGREVEILVYDRTDGMDRLVLPTTQEKVRFRVVPYRLREPSTTILLDEQPPEEKIFGRPTPSPTRADEALELTRVFRQEAVLSEAALTVDPGVIPPTPDGFDGIDHFVVASDRLALDPGGVRALRQWAQRGGKLWVMLDAVGPDLPAALLGESIDFQVVDRVGLTSFKIEPLEIDPNVPPPAVQFHERPVAFVRVLLPPGEKAPHTVNGWPAWFTRPVGKGMIVFTTLGPRAWARPRGDQDPRSTYQSFPNLPVADPAFATVAVALQPTTVESPVPLEVFRPLLNEEIGYAVAGRGTVALVFGVFLAVTLVLGVAVRRSRRPERVGWLAPAAALGAAAVVFGLGESARRAVPPTVAVVQVVSAVPGAGEAEVHGLLAVYRPDSGPAAVGTSRGGLFDLDMAGLDGQTRRRIGTDMDAWHWDNLALPAGVRFATFRLTVPTPTALEAVARFGPSGVEGDLRAGPFENAGDAVLSSAGGRNLAIRMGAGGAFAAGGADVLAAGEFLPGAVLTNRQQRRQALYREIVGRPGFGPTDARPVLMAWADPVDPHFDLVAGARTAGAAILVVPVRFEPPVAGTVVTVPGPLVPFQRMIQGHRVRPRFEMSSSLDMEVRFQLPATVLPFTVERAKLVAKIAAPSRKVAITGRGANGPIELHAVNSPLDPFRVDIADAAILRPDDEGGLYLNLTISPSFKGSIAGGEKWTLEYLELEVTGRHP